MPKAIRLQRGGREPRQSGGYVLIHHVYQEQPTPVNGHSKPLQTLWDPKKDPI